jgi:membrane protease YdiL (CAAX protease family)
MSTLPEPDPLNPEDSSTPAEAHSPEPAPMENWQHQPLVSKAWPSRRMPAEPVYTPTEQPAADPLLLQSWAQLPVPPPARIPNFGHVLLLIPLLGLSFVVAVILFLAAIHFHLYGVSSPQQAAADIHYLLGTEAILYIFTFAASLLIFPLFWHKSLLAGLQWNGATALRLRGRLASAAFVCFLLAMVNGEFMPGPTNAPIEKIFHAPGAAWILFGFGITFAPFFEEMFFRGFLLPALSTAYDWFAEKTTGELRRPLGPNGHPQWSFPAMVVASIVTSIPFAALHAQQTSYSIGPFLLLVCVSLVLCAVRLYTRSLAASVMVHACYNFLLFSIMLIGTGGFRHLDKM